MTKLSKIITLGSVALSPWLVAGCRGDAAASVPAVTTLSPDGVQHTALSISPDGKRVAYWEPAGDKDGQFQLWIANADFTSPVKLLPSGFSIPVAWSKDGSKILATSFDGFGKVVVVPTAGGPEKRVTPGTAFQNHIMFHPDGDRILYIEFREGGTFGLGAVSLATGERRDAIPGEKRSTFGMWSPDGKHLAYTTLDAGKSMLWVADADGSSPRQLTTEGYEDLNGNQFWSPDSKEILYESRRTGNPDLWVAPIDGGKPRQLTRDIRRDYRGAWSSDGKWIAFASDRGRQADLWVVPSQGGQEIRVTDDAAEEDFNNGFSTWIPGTHTLAFVSGTTTRSVWSIGTDGAGAKKLTADSISVAWIGLSPDGKQIALANQHPGNIFDLAVVPVAGGPIKTLVAGGGTVVTPAWSSDGQQIAFRSDREGNEHVFIVPVTGGTPRRALSGSAFDQSFAWSGTDASLYVQSDKNARLAELWKVPPAGEPTQLTQGAAVLGVGTAVGSSVVMVNALEKKTGVVGLYRLQPDGSLLTIYDKSNAFLGPISPKGDSVMAGIQQPDGSFQPMLYSVNGGAGRPIGALNQAIETWAKDGRFGYRIRQNGKSKVGVFNSNDGSSRLLTSGNDDEVTALITPDGSTIVYRVDKTVLRIRKVNLESSLASATRK